MGEVPKVPDPVREDPAAPDVVPVREDPAAPDVDPVREDPAVQDAVPGREDPAAQDAVPVLGPVPDGRHHRHPDVVQVRHRDEVLGLLRPDSKRRDDGRTSSST